MALIGSTYVIARDIVDIDYVDIHISRNGGIDWEVIELNVPISHYTSEDLEIYSPLSYNWIVTGPTSNNCLIRVAGSGEDSDISKISSTPFAITETLPANSFSSTPARNNQPITSTINNSSLLAYVSGDAYFNSISQVRRVEVYYGHTGGRQAKRIIHQGNPLIGTIKWSNFAKPGTWCKIKIKVFDTDGALHLIDRSQIEGSVEDIIII